MDTQRSTREFTTENSHVVVMYDYVTGNEARDIKRVSEENDGGAAAMEKAQDYAVGLVVRSLNGTADTIVERIGNLPLPDYSEIVAAVTELLNPKKK